MSRIIGEKEIINLTVELALKEESFSGISSRKIALSGGFPIRVIYILFENSESLIQDAIHSFINQSVQQTQFVSKAYSSLRDTFDEFELFFFSCFCDFPYKKLLLEDTRCRIEFYNQCIEPLFEDIEKEQLKRKFSSLSRQVLLF